MPQRCWWLDVPHSCCGSSLVRELITNAIIQINEIPPNTPPIRSPVLSSESVESIESASCDGVDSVESVSCDVVDKVDSGLELGLELPLLAASGLGLVWVTTISAFEAELEQAATHASIEIDPFEPTNMSSDLGAVELTQ